MALCLAVSLVTQKEFRLYDQLVRYKWWFRDGYMSSTGACFEIGQATSESLQEFERRQVDFARQNSVAYRDMDNLSSGEALRQFNVYCSKEGVADNGALMRLAPVPLFFHRYPEYAVEYSGRSGQITHGDVKAYDACRYYGALIVAALRGYRRDEILDNRFYSNHAAWFKNRPLCPEVREVAEGSYKRRGGYKDGIRGKGYIVNALEAALWAFWSDENSFEKGALAAVNLGDDTDATAAIYGQLAGAYYGYDKLPCHWVKHLYAKRFIVNLSKWITYEGEKSPPTEVLPTYTPLVSSQLPAIDINKNKSRSNVNPVHNENAASKRNVTAYHDKKQDRKAMKRQQLRPTASETSLYSWVQSNSNPQDTDSHQPSQTDELKAKQPLVKSNSIARSTRNKTTRFQLDTSVPLKKPPTQNNNHGLPLRHVRTVSSMMEYFPSSAPNKNQMPAIPVDNKPSPTSKPPNAALNIRLHSKNINPVQVSSNNPLSFHSPTIVECSSKTTSQLNKSDSKYRLLDTTNINTRLNSSSASGEFQTQLSYLATTAEAQYAPDASITNILISDACK
jgi:ADP-ribosyl-[dinitrogen reductase] hydrolase